MREDTKILEFIDRLSVQTELSCPINENSSHRTMNSGFEIKFKPYIQNKIVKKFKHLFCFHFKKFNFPKCYFYLNPD